MGLKYYDEMNDAPVSYLLRQASIKNENQWTYFSDSSWKYCPDYGRSTWEYIIFYQVSPIDNGTHVPGPVAKSIAESEYNAACTSGMVLAHFRMLIHEFLNKDPYKVPGEAPLIILDNKYDVCMAKHGKDTNHTRHITRKIHLVRHSEKWKMHKIDWCEGDLKLADIATDNSGEHGLALKIKYSTVRLYNRERTLVQEGWQETV